MDRPQTAVEAGRVSGDGALSRRRELAQQLAQLTSEARAVLPAKREAIGAAEAAVSEARGRLSEAEGALATARLEAATFSTHIDHQMSLVKAELRASAPAAISAFKYDVRTDMGLKQHPDGAAAIQAAMRAADELALEALAPDEVEERLAQLQAQLPNTGGRAAVHGGGAS